MVYFLGSREPQRNGCHRQTTPMMQSDSYPKVGTGAKTVIANGVLDITKGRLVPAGKYAVTSHHCLRDLQPGSPVLCGGEVGTYDNGTEQRNVADIGLVRVGTNTEVLNKIGLPGGGTHMLSRCTQLIEGNSGYKTTDGFSTRPGLRVIVDGATSGPREALVDSVCEHGFTLKEVDGRKFKPGDSGAPVVIHQDPRANYTNEEGYNTQLDSHAGELLGMLVGRFAASETTSMVYFFSSSLGLFAQEATLSEGRSKYQQYGRSVFDPEDSEWDTAVKAAKNLRTMLPEKFPEVSSLISGIKVTLRANGPGSYYHKPVILCSIQNLRNLATTIKKQMDCDGFLSRTFGEMLSGEINGVEVRVVEEDTTLQLLCDIRMKRRDLDLHVSVHSPVAIVIAISVTVIALLTVLASVVLLALALRGSTQLPQYPDPPALAEVFTSIHLAPSGVCTPIHSAQELSRELAEVGDWENLCFHLGVDRSVIERLKHSNKQLEVMKMDCLVAYYNRGKGEACWERVVGVAKEHPFHHHRLAEKITQKYLR